MILIDDRSGSAILQPAISAPTVLTRLEFADASFLGNGPPSADGSPTLLSIGIERKTVHDLVSSIASGRLSGHQLVGLLSHYDRVYLLVEGLYRPNPRSGLLESYSKRGWRSLTHGSRSFMYKYVSNYINTLTSICGVSHYNTHSLSHSGRWITDLYYWWQKPWESHSAHLQFHPQDPCPAPLNLTKPPYLRRAVGELTGIGGGGPNSKGAAICRYFNSMFELVLATVKDLEQIPGIGKKLATSIYGELRGMGKNGHS